MNTTSQNKFNHEPIEFLLSDFNQSFEQSRYYDSQIVNIFKFLATFYTTIAGITIGLYQYSVDHNIHITCGLVCGLIIALFFGLAMFSLVVRNRLYFVVCMRYINEQRQLFLSFNPMGFKNKTKYYTDYTTPPFFNYLSSQSLWLYIIAFLNTVLLQVIFYIVSETHYLVLLSFFISQLFIAIIYLYSREKKSVSNAVFGGN